LPTSGHIFKQINDNGDECLNHVVDGAEEINRTNACFPFTYLHGNFVNLQTRLVGKHERLWLRIVGRIEISKKIYGPAAEGPETYGGISNLLLGDE